MPYHGLRIGIPGSLLAGVPSWVPNQTNPPDWAVNWSLGSVGMVWRKGISGLISSTAFGITTSRTSSKMVVDASGRWSQVAQDVTATSNLGRSSEEARTNSIRNNSMVGAVVGADSVELVTNGNFASAGGGWASATSGGGAVSFAANSATISGDGSTFGTYISQVVSGLTVGRSYVFSIASSGGLQFALAVGSSTGGNQVAGFTAVNANGAAATTPDRIAFTATSSAHWITVSRVAAGNAVLTGVSVQDGERVENGGFTSSPVSGSQNTFQNGWEWDADAANTGTIVYNGSSAVTLSPDGIRQIRTDTNVATVIGTTYTFKFTTTGAGNPGVGVGPTRGSSALLGGGFSAGSYTLQFTATSTTSWIRFYGTNVGSFAISAVSVQSAGAMPTNWIALGNYPGLVQTVTGIGTESGLNYIDVRLNGTTTSVVGGAGFCLSDSAVAASYGQTWTGSVFAKLAAGTLNNIGFALVVTDRTSGFGFLAQTSSAIVPTGAALGTQRNQVSRTLISSTTAIVDTEIQVSWASGVAIDATLRVGPYQLENNNFLSAVASATIAAGGTVTGATRTMYVIGGGGVVAGAAGTATISAGAVTAYGPGGGAYGTFPTAPTPIADSSIFASISGTVMTVTAASGASLAVGQLIVDPTGAVTAGTTISSLGTGTGGNGTYNLSNSMTVSARGLGTLAGSAAPTVNLVPVNNAAAGFATSPILTSGSALGRAADNTVLTGLSVGANYSAYEQAIANTPSPYVNQFPFGFSNGAAGSSFTAIRFVGSPFGNLLNGAGAGYGIGNVPANTSFKAMIALLGSGSQAGALSGAYGTTAQAGAPSTISQFNFNNIGGEIGVFTTMVNAVWLNQAVPQAQMQAATT